MNYNLEREVTKLEKYLVKQGREDFIKEVRGMSTESLEAKLLGLAKHREEIRNTKARDQELIEATNRKKGLEQPYTEQARMNGKLARFVALVMADVQSDA